VPSSDGSGLLWVTWVDHDDIPHLARYSGSTLESELTFLPGSSPYDDQGHVSISLSTDELGDTHLIYLPSMSLYRDSLFCFNPYNEMLLEDKFEFSYYPGWGFANHNLAGLLRFPDGFGCGLLGLFQYEIYSSGSSFFWGTLEFRSHSSGYLVPGRYLELSDPYPIDGSVFNTQYRFESPVVNYSGVPLMASMRYKAGYGGTPGTYRIFAHSHNLDEDTLSLTEDIVYSFSDTGETPGISALGASSEDIMLIWWDIDEVLRCTVYDGTSVSSVEEYPFPGDGPIPNFAAAMTSRPTEEGLLLAWRDSFNRILCRHYDGEWNEYAHVAAADAWSLAEDNLAVCSVEDGYWIVWLPSASSYPEFVFVQRDMVTSIGEESNTESSLFFDVWPNPFMNLLHVSLTDVPENCLFEVFDNTGRLVHQSDVENTEICWNSSRYPSGAYYVRISTNDAVTGKKVVLIR
jgi:hypothetical protein